MRKDVDCVFGILKGWWRILKTGIRGVQGVEAVDKVWLTCCALHNWLLEIDGLDADWDSQTLPTVSDWEGEMGQIDTKGLSPNVLQLATSHELRPRNYNTSGMGPDANVNESEERHPADIDRSRFNSVLTLSTEKVRHMSNLGLGFFRSRLVKHFDIMFKQNKIK